MLLGKYVDIDRQDSYCCYKIHAGCCRIVTFYVIIQYEFYKFSANR